MSVSLFTSTEVAKIANTLKEELDPRAVWYAYVSNVTAYNLQYQEDAVIDFKGWEAAGDETLTREEALNELRGLEYNAYTNAGNCFMPARELEHLGKFLKANPRELELANYNND
jgi:hypothetical protein